MPARWPQVNWKVRRGKWRGPLVGYARQADDGEVQAASHAAFAALRGGGSGGKEPGEEAVKAALDAMCVIYVSAGGAARCFFGGAHARCTGLASDAGGRCCPAIASCWHAVSPSPPPTPPPPAPPAPGHALGWRQGVGPATASAVLQALDPSVPYTSDQAMLAALGSRDYKGGWPGRLSGAASLAAAGGRPGRAAAQGRRWSVPA